MKNLGELFLINSGLVSKRKEAPPNVIGFDYKLLNLRSVNQLGFIEKNCLDDFMSTEKIDDKYLARTGDIVIRLSTPFTAAVIDQDSQGAIITSLFAILRLTTHEVIPDYVAMYLNSEVMKKQYLKDASGSALQMIKTSAIKEYSIKIPTVNKQRQFIQINKLFIRESILLEELIENKKRYNKIMMNKLMEE